MFHVFSINRYGVISRQSSVLFFGGVCNDQSFSLIARYTIDDWEHVGNLQDKRYVHRTIENDNRIYVVGGHETRYIFDENKNHSFINLFSKTEIWSLDENDNMVNLKIADPNLSDYSWFPELFIVNSDFCVKK